MTGDRAPGDCGDGDWGDGDWGTEDFGKGDWGYGVAVADLRFGHAVAVDGTAVEVSSELAAIDRAGPEAWLGPLSLLLRPGSTSGPVLLGVPSTWGAPRRDVLGAAVGQLGAGAQLVPRAELIAASHADAAARTVVVVETAIVPDAGPRWSLTRVEATPGGWRCSGWQVMRAGLAPGADLASWGEPAPGEGPAPGGQSAPGEEQPLWCDADTVFVDGPAPLSGAVASLRDLAAPVRCLAVDHELLRRHGASWAGTGDPPAAAPLPPVPVRGPVRRALAAAALVAVLVLAGVASTRLFREPQATSVAAVPGPSDAVAAVVARVGPVAVDVSGDWKRTDRGGGDEAYRATFADPRDGRRILVVVTRLRSGASAETVAASLRNRIGERGDDAVVEFSDRAEYAGRTVIAYRENPVSGSAIRWYVAVEQGSQISIGCQPGTSAEAVDEACRMAVASAAVTAPDR